MQRHQLISGRPGLNIWTMDMSCVCYNRGNRDKCPNPSNPFTLMTDNYMYIKEKS